ncbi:MAG: GHKL domain-containing protein [Clostridia bacterium]|nr:GHKL domain-containing protein [Clostridia bacterium]
MTAVWIIIYVIEALIAFMYFYDNFKLKKGYLLTFATILGLYFICYWVNEIGQNNAIINEAAFLLATFAFAKYCFEISIKAAMFHTTILTMVMSLTEFITEIILDAFFGIPLYSYRDSISALIIIAILTKLLYMIIAKILAWAFSYKYNRRLDKSSYLLFAFPIIITTLVTLVWYFFGFFKVDEKMKMIFAVICTASVFLSAVLLMYNRYIDYQRAELDELKQERIKGEMNMQYLTLLEEKNQQMQIMAHDYKNHLFALGQMSDNAEVKSYIEKISGEIQKAGKGCDSGNHTLDILLNKYITESERKGISFEYDVKLANLGFVEDYDLVTIVGNLLDNALEAAEQSAEKKITLNTAKVNTYDSLTVTNSCDTPPDKNLKTTKKNKQMHGLGIKSIQKAVKKYEGELEWEYDESEKTFSITIILLSKTV